MYDNSELLYINNSELQTIQKQRSVCPDQNNQETWLWLSFPSLTFILTTCDFYFSQKHKHYREMSETWWITFGLLI